MEPHETKQSQGKELTLLSREAFRRDSCLHYTGFIETRVLVDPAWICHGDPSAGGHELGALAEYAQKVSTPTKILDGDQYNDSLLAPMADGERFIFFDQPDRKAEDDHLTIVLNWAAEVRRQFEEK